MVHLVRTAEHLPRGSGHVRRIMNALKHPAGSPLDKPRRVFVEAHTETADKQGTRAMWGDKFEFEKYTFLSAKKRIQLKKTTVPTGFFVSSVNLSAND